MAVSLREYPIIQGNDARRFLEKAKANSNNINKLLEKKMACKVVHDRT